MKKLAVVIGCLVAVGVAHATLVVEESFDYTAGTMPNGTLNGGTGFNGAWTVANADETGIGAITSGLSLTGVTSSGNSFIRADTSGDSQITREISSASQTTLTADGSTMWFSALVGMNAWSRATRPAFIFGDQGFDSDGSITHTGTGMGFAVKSDGGIYAYGASGGNNQGLTFLDTGKATGTYLVVGKIDWNATGTADTLSVWGFKEGDTVSVAGAADSTLSLDLTNSTFDTVAWTDNQANGLDEIRLGTDFLSVVPDSSGSPRIIVFEADPDAVETSGTAVTLSWEVLDATGLSISPDIGDVLPVTVDGVGQTQVVVSAATTYSLIATNAEGSVTSSVPLSVVLHPPTIESFTYTDLGETIELAWQVTGADTLSIDNGIGDVTGLTSTQIVDSGVSGYILTATNTDGVDTAWAGVQLTGLVVEEPFDYDAGTMVDGALNGGSGFGGAWAVTNSSTGLGAITNGLSMTDVGSSDNSYTRSELTGSSQIAREISTAAQASLTADGSTMWFSMLVGLNGWSSTATDPAFLFADEGFDGSLTHSGSGMGFYIKDSVDGLVAYGFNSGSDTAGTGVYTNIVNTLGTYLVVGKIDWNAAGSNDVLSLWGFADGDAITVDGAADSTLSLDLNNSTFDTVTWTDDQASGLDEIRLGTSFSAVLPGPSEFEIIAFDVDATSLALTWTGGGQSTQYIEMSTYLVDSNSWTVVGTNLPPIEATNSWNSALPADPAGFYRIITTP